MICRIALAAFALLFASLPATSAFAQRRKPTVVESAAVHVCAVKNRDDFDKGEHDCLFKLVGDPFIGKLGAVGDATTADCYYVEEAIWDDLLNENYKTLLGTLDSEQAAKARIMQRDWIAYRDSTCQFYDDKIRGSMAIMMHAACVTRETARRAMLLGFFSRL
jgi:uncharacterized protein YecT (DUF1311 family)